MTSDDAGRISDQAGWHYLYDAKARLVSACKSSACTGTGFDRLDFEYDGEGHRTKITTTPAAGAAAVYTFRYQGDAIAAEYKDGTLIREYTLDSAGTISKVTVPGGQTGAGTYLVTWNGHGDALALYRIESNGSLTLANSYTYGTWGTPTTSTHNSIADLGFRFLYVGAADVQWDSAYGLDLMYMHARHYSPSLGRFLQPDPSRLDTKLFVYAGNGPVSHVDPDGRRALMFDAAGGGGGGGGAVIVVIGIVVEFFATAAAARLWFAKPTTQATYGNAPARAYAAEPWLLTKNKELRKRRTGLQNQIDIHERKIRNNPDAWEVPHWEKEIRGWQRQVDEINRKLKLFRRWMSNL